MHQHQVRGHQKRHVNGHQIQGTASMTVVMVLKVQMWSAWLPQ
jgi:hypothetical protein